MGGTGEAKLARDAWTLPNPHAPRSSPQSLFVKEGFQGVADADSQTSGSVPLYHPGAYPLCQRGTEGDFGESRDTHHPKASLRPHPRHPPEADCPSAHRERAISASCERERARNTSNNPKGRVPRACPWGNENSPVGRQAKLVIKKCHGLARGYLRTPGSNPLHHLGQGRTRGFQEQREAGRCSADPPSLPLGHSSLALVLEVGINVLGDVGRRFPPLLGAHVLHNGIAGDVGWASGHHTTGIG